MNVAETRDLASLRPADRGALRDLLVTATAAASRPEQYHDAVVSALGRAPVDLLADAAALHRVPGTVRRGLVGVDGLPDHVSASLEGLGRASTIQHLVIMGALGNILRAFDDAGLSWVVMKGPVLAAYLYPGVGDRTYGDLDLLVTGADFPEGMRILEDFGYRHDIHDWALADQMLAGAVGMASRAARMDLHWHLHYSQVDRRQFALDPTEMIGRNRRLAVSGVSIPTFDPEDMLLSLCFHAARSGGHRLVWLKDVERALAVDEPDLDELVRRSRRYGCAAPVGLILDRAHGALGADVPSDTVNALVPATMLAADRAIRRSMGPARLHERDTIARWLSRSVRESFASTVAAVPGRSVRTARRYLRSPRPNETDDAQEKSKFLRAVVAASSRPA